MSGKIFHLTLSIYLVLTLQIYAQFYNGICGIDNRSLSYNAAIGRISVYDYSENPPTIEPMGTAFIISDDKLVTAGHIAGTIDFNTNTNFHYFVEFIIYNE